MKKLVKMLLILAVTISCSFNADAAFLQNIKQTIIQPDGTKLECFATGDEFYSWLHDANDYTIIQNPETGFYVYADKIGDELVPTSLIFGKEEPQSLNLQKRLLISNEKYLEIRKPFDEQQKVLFLERKELFNKSGNQFQSGQRTIENIVIFVEFADASFTKTDLTEYEKAYNTDNLSMRAYYDEVSYNNCIINTHFFPTSTDGQIKTFKSQKTRGYLQPQSASNPQGYSNNGDRIMREIEMLEEIILATKPAISASLNLDSDNDGWVDAITIIFQGDANPSTALWPHALTSGSALTIETINSKRIRKFNALLETHSSKDVAIHEMGHILGAPDFYTYDPVRPIECWDPMSNNILEPPHFMMHLKEKYFGWVNNIPEITQAGTYTLNPVTSATNNCYRINSPYSDDEYFLVEYRRHISGRFGGDGLKSVYPQNNGLLIYRIVPSVNGNLHSLDNGLPYEVYIYRPNGTTTANGTTSQALYSNEYQRISINDDNSNPHSFLSTGEDGGLDISAVQLINNGEQIQFEIKIPDIYYNLSIVINGEGTVATDPTPPTNLPSGTEVTLRANAGVNYRFKNWTDANSKELSTENPYTITLTKNRTIYANFEMTTMSPIVTIEADNGAGSLRQIVRDAPTGSTIIFADSVRYITLTSGQIEITKNLTIDGGSDTTRKITISGNDNSRIFYVDTNRTLNINNLILTKGYDTRRNNRGGGAVYVGNSRLTATNCNFSENYSYDYGGAISLQENSICTLTNCNFSENSTTRNAGAIWINEESIVIATNCNFNKNSSYNNGGAISLQKNGICTLTNCNFIQNSADNMGGAIMANEAIVTATNCNFSENSAGTSGAINVNWLPITAFIAINCTFNKNFSSYGGAIVNHFIFIAINCTFYENIADSNYGGAIIHERNGDPYTYLYHCTFDNNQAKINGGGIYNRNYNYRPGLYSYNCIYTGNTPNQIYFEHTTTFNLIGNNLIEGENGITRDMVFGTNEFNPVVGYITPLPFATTATKLITSNIQVPARTTIAEILSKLATDQAGKPRPYLTYSDNEYVTFGSVEATTIKTFTLTVNKTHGGTTTPLGTSTRDTGEVVVIEAMADSGYKFINWTNANGTELSRKRIDTITMVKDSVLTAHFAEKRMTITIRADAHTQLDPRRRNYRIPIYIKADEDISDITIEKLVIEVDRNLFCPRRIENNNGTMTLNFIDTMIEMTFENVLVPALKANEEKVLLVIRGDVLLGNKDSNDIFIRAVKFSEELNEELELLNGYITLEICRAGGDRLVEYVADYFPTVTVKNNPVTSSTLEVRCNTIERGNYSLEIIDLLGYTPTTLNEWTVTANTIERIFNFEFSIQNYPNGSYLLVMNAPTKRYSTRFIIQK